MTKSNILNNLRIEAFQRFSLRFGLCVSALPLFSLLGEFLGNTWMARSVALYRILSFVGLLFYPLALLKRIRTKHLPWVLYGGSTIVLALAALVQLHDGNALGFMLTGYSIVFWTPILGLAYPFLVNVSLACALMTFFLIIQSLTFGLASMLLMFAPVGLILLLAIGFLHRQFDLMLQFQHSYLRRMEKMAMKDVLTGLYNRRYFMEIGTRILLSGKRNGRPVALLMVDIDHFKSVNDLYGHDAGDAILRETAKCLRKSVRGTDLVARLGGEEIAILLPESDRSASLVLAERARLNLADNGIQVQGRQEPIRITASFGVAVARAGSENLQALLKDADEALYQAKQAGRNRVVVMGEGAG